MNTDRIGFHTCKECHKNESLWNHTTTDHKEGEQLEDRRSVGARSCNCGDGTDQRVQSLVFMMMMVMMMMMKANSCTAGQEIPVFYGIWRLSHRVQNSPSFVSFWSHSKPWHTLPFYLRSASILSSHLFQGIPRGLFTSDLKTKTTYAVSSHAHCYVSCQPHRPWLRPE